MLHKQHLPIFNMPQPAANGTVRGYSMQALGPRFAEIHIYDVIGDSYDGTTGKQFAKDLKALGNVDELRIFINSPGGSVFDGMAIVNQLTRHKARKLVVIDGMALSIASVIAMSGDEISIAGNAHMMIHDPWTIGVGSAADLRKTADTLDKVEIAIVNSYTARTGLESSQVAEMMHEETWMDAREAVELGFADSIGAEVQIAAKARGFDFSRFRHPPKALAELAGQAVPVSTYAPRIAAMRRRLTEGREARGAGPATSAA